MSIQQQVDDIMEMQQEAVNVTEAAKMLELAVQETKNIFAATGESLTKICAAVERSASRDELVKALGRLNSITHIFLEVTATDGEARTVLDAVSSLPSSLRFQELLGSQESLAEAIKAYKTLVAKDLAVSIQRKKKFLRSTQAQDCELFDTLLPEQEASIRNIPAEAPTLLERAQGTASSGKGGFLALSLMKECYVFPRRREV